jgi:predicted nucleic acid-binding protein
MPGAVEGFVAAHGIATLAWFLQRQLGAAAGRAAVAEFLSGLSVAGLDDVGLRSAVASETPDVEDALVVAAALRADVAQIVTRDVAGFSRSPVRAISPAAFVAERLAEDRG